MGNYVMQQTCVVSMLTNTGLIQWWWEKIIKKEAVIWPEINIKHRVTMNEQSWTRHSGFSFSTQIWHLCPKLTSRVLKSFNKNKVASSEIWTHNSSHHWIRILTASPTQPPSRLLSRRFLYWSWIISRINRAWIYKGLKMWDWQGMTDWLSG